MSSSSKVDSSWSQPSPSSISHATGLHVTNSLTGKLELFTTKNGSRKMKWYMNGPIQCDSTHLGHARTYLAFDIVKKILCDYLMYDVTLVMSVTDIDDKIIARSLEQGITCTELSREFEVKFLEDMESLGVSPPDIITRASEFIPQTIKLIERIIEQEVAYESNGSVYFSVANFRAMPGKTYCKLSPKEFSEGEGGEMEAEFLSDKQFPLDFHLWRKSKPDEPSWDSPWGPGRPRWHIQCSAMACDIFKNITMDETTDLCSGGNDNKHRHDNVLAQSEAASDSCNQWVNYFLHTGNLNVEGLKMSKSKQNFITIGEALEHYSPRQIRLFFLLHKYNSEVNYSSYKMYHACSVEKKLVNFFENCKALLVQYPINSFRKWDDHASYLHNHFQESKDKVHSALLNDFDTPAVIYTLLDMIKMIDLYTINNINIVSLIVRNCALYVTKILKMFGLIPSVSDMIGFPLSIDEEKQRQDFIAPIISALMDFRNRIKQLARDKFSRNLDTEVLDECRELREIMPPLGISIEDKPDGSCSWKFEILDAEE